MFRKSLTVIVLLMLVAGSATAEDLYQVTLHSSAEADQLDAMSVDPIHGGNNVYVVLADSLGVLQLTQSGLDIALLASGVTREQLAMDSRRDRANIERFELLYEQGDYRLFRVSPSVFGSTTEAPPVFPLLDMRPKIVYHDVRTLDKILSTEIVGGLDTIIAKVRQDSLQSYVEGLQSFQTRVAGTASNYASRDWIIDKLHSFGYDSVVTDSFNAWVYGGYLPCQNVVAYKIGTKYPDYHLIVGAHRDAVPTSPGADDNGSGSAAVMEMARVLKDVNTDLTIVFCLFDAEESGLLGSEHYVSDALIAGEDIAFMFNMDMIGHYENYNQADVHYGDDDTYARLWIQLADSLVGLTGHLAGTSGASDHYPFSLAGYPVAYAAEYIFSTVYHSYQDSTTYMSFSYMTKMAKASLATIYQVNSMLQPAPYLRFAHPDGLPTMLTPGYPTPYEIEINGVNYGEIVPSSATLYYSIDGASYQSEQLDDLGDSRFRAILPSASCYNTIKYYVAAEEVESGMFFDGSSEHPYWATVATDYAPTFEDDFEIDQGWSTTWSGAYTGFWERGVPINDPYSQWDPLTDASGPGGQCFVTGNGDGEDVDEGTVLLWTPRFSLPEDASISYDYFLSLSKDDGIDQMIVEITPEYGVVPWMTVAVHNTDGQGFWRHNVLTWQELEAVGMTSSSHARMRFVVNDDDPQSTVEAGIDNFSVGNYDCQIIQCCGAYTAGYTGNTDCDTEGKTNLADITMLIDRVYLSKQPLCCEPNGNVDGDTANALNLADITVLIDHVYLSKSPTALCD